MTTTFPTGYTIATKLPTPIRDIFCPKIMHKPLNNSQESTKRTLSSRPCLFKFQLQLSDALALVL